jgi:hypothetical protein
MSFKIAADNDATHAPVLEFDRIMVFGNLAGKTDCVISSHGTEDLTQQPKANGNFDVPAGMRVHFYCYNGFTYVPDDITTQFSICRPTNAARMPASWSMMRGSHARITG